MENHVKVRQLNLFAEYLLNDWLKFQRVLKPWYCGIIIVNTTRLFVFLNPEVLRLYVIEGFRFECHLIFQIK